MELKEYLEIIKKNLIFVLVVSISAMVLASLLAKSLPSGYVQTQTFFIANTQSAQDPTSAFDNQEKARNFTDSLIAIAQSQDFRNEVEAQGDSISAKKSAPQVITLTASSKSPQGSKSLISKTQAALNSKLTALNTESMQLKAIGTPAEPALSKTSPKASAAAGLVLGFAFALFALSLKAYFKL